MVEYQLCSQFWKAVTVQLQWHFGVLAVFYLQFYHCSPVQSLPDYILALVQEVIVILREPGRNVLSTVLLGVVLAGHRYIYCS